MRRAFVALACVAGAGLLSACVIAPQPVAGYSGYPVYDTGPNGAVVVAPQAPPPLQVEVMGVAPAPGYLWIAGFWGWAGGRYAWNAGHWSPPRPGYRWEPRSWTPGAGGWHQHGGYWRR